MVLPSAIWFTTPFCTSFDHLTNLGSFIPLLLGILSPILTLSLVDLGGTWIVVVLR
jgi:uncharacterized membrane protein